MDRLCVTLPHAVYVPPENAGTVWRRVPDGTY